MGPRLPLPPRHRHSAAALGRTMSGPGGAAASGTPPAESGDTPAGNGDTPALPRDYELAGKVGDGAGRRRGEQGWSPSAPTKVEIGARPPPRGEQEDSGGLSGATRFLCHCAQEAAAGRGRGKT